MKTDIDLDDILHFMQSVAREAGLVLLSFFDGRFRVHLKNTDKSQIDIVTDADRASEEIILEAIRRRFPHHDVISEERAPEIRGSRLKWFVDPLDGTVNFAHGFPVFCISIAVAEDDRLVAGIIYDPLRDECFSASRGGGAFRNGDPIRVSSASRLIQSMVATGFPYDKATSPENNIAEFNRVATQVQAMRRAGSAAIDLAYVSCGRVDGFWELKLKPWDMAAGMLLVEEAHGRVSDRWGKTTDVYTDSIVATNGLIHNALIDLISPGGNTAPN